MNLELKKKFRAETGKDVFDWNEDNEVVFTQEYVNWLEKRVKLFDIPDVVGRSEQLKAFVDWWHGLSQEELVWYEGRYVEVFLSL